MGLFGFGKNKISNKKISNTVFERFQSVGPPKEIDTASYKERYIKMLNDLDSWATENNFTDMNRSAISGEIENILRTTYRNTGYDDVVQDYINLCRRIILPLHKDWNF